MYTIHKPTGWGGTISIVRVLKKRRRVAVRQMLQDTGATRKTHSWVWIKQSPPALWWFLGTSGKAHGRVIMLPKPREGNQTLSCIHPLNKLHFIPGETNWNFSMGKMTFSMGNMTVTDAETWRISLTIPPNQACLSTLGAPRVTPFAWCRLVCSDA